MDEDVDRGLELDAADWYNTEELRDWFIKELGDIDGDREFRGFINLMGTTSPNSGVLTNIGNASMVRRRLATEPDYVSDLLEAKKLADVQGAKAGRYPGYGHLTANTQELATARYTQGLYDAPPQVPNPTRIDESTIVQNPKPKGFINSFLGNTTNIAADLHFTRYMGMASGDPQWLGAAGTTISQKAADEIIAEFPRAAKYITMKKNPVGKMVPTLNPRKLVEDGVVPIEKLEAHPKMWAEKPNDNEYAAFEDFVGHLAKERGLTPAQYQAALWMGAAKRTGVDDSSQGTFMQLLRDRADLMASKSNMTRAEVIKRFIREKGLLSVPAVAVGAGAVQALPQEQTEL
tara:strand:+ start:138 stop:1178 length:1041 start_codon:yes stop_codon:yes gene_type:complete